MRLRKVELSNFRQFYGDQTLVFAEDPQRNVTLIHAENGFGKTTLLNSIFWALFEDVTKKFEDSAHLVSFAALAEGKATAGVEVDFVFQDSPYVVQRSFSNETRRSRMSASAIEGGVHKALTAPETFIQSVVPREMAKYFFFDGEGAEAFSSQTNHRAVGEAIRNILGCALAETAIGDLRDLAKDYEKEIGASADSADIQRHQKTILDCEDRLEDLNKTVVGLEAERDDRRDQLAKVTSQLRGLEAARALQAEREEKEADLKAVAAELKAARQQQLGWLGTEAIFVISERLTKETLDFVDDASLRGKIPSPYNEDFVRSLLHSMVCVCKRSLEVGTPHYAAVADMLQSASNADTHSKVIRARSRVTTLQRDAAAAPERLRTIQATIGALTARRTRLEQAIGELGTKIENLPVAEIAEREAARNTLDKTVARLTEEIGAAKLRVKTCEGELETHKKQSDRLMRNNKKAQRILQRRKLADEARELLEGHLSTYQEAARSAIKEKVDAILSDVAHRDYVCELAEDFSLRLQMRSGHGIPKSGGENQLLSLVFIGALVQYAASRLNDKTVILRPGTVAPLVLDAPLGQLDIDYQQAVAKYLPTLADQVVLLLSSSQCGPRVLEALEPRIGAEYVLVSENTEPRAGRGESRIVIGTKEYACSEFNRPRQMTRIERIR